jgi:hypothetical protein
MGMLQNEKQLARFDYDFAKQGGALGAIALAANIKALAAGMVITDMYIYVEKALTSAGAHTVTLGNLDADGFFVDFAALAAADNSVIRAGQLAGALLWDNANDAMLAYRVAADLLLNLTVGTAALTAGKLQVYVEYFAPKAA